MKKRSGDSRRPSGRLEAQLRLSLEEIEGDFWGEPTFRSSLVTRVHQMRKVPLRDLSIEDLRIAIGQKVGLRHLLPLALTILERDPLAEGDLYPGDLLCVVARAADTPLLLDEPHLAERLRSLLEQALAELSEADVHAEVEGEIHAALGRIK